MKQFTLGNYTLDDFADYLQGANNAHFEGIEGNELLLTGEHQLTKKLELHFPITITGDGATISGAKLDSFAITICASNTTVRGVTFESTNLGVEVDAKGKLVENVLISKVNMFGGGTIIETGSTMSDSTLRNVMIQDCCHNVEEKHEWGDNAMDAPVLPYNIICARYIDNAIHNCVLENVTVDRCSKIGGTRAGILCMGGFSHDHNFMRQDVEYSNLKIINLNFTNNHLDMCWDGAYSLLGGYLKNGEVLVDGVTIDNNFCEHGIAGLYFLGNGPMLGANGGVVVKNVAITNNHFVRGVADIGEPIRSIWVNASRTDYFPGVDTFDTTIDNVEISGNKLEGGGIVVTGAYALLDGVSNHTNNVVSNVTVCNNTILDADVPFRFEGAQLEGRLFDWQFGYPPRNNKWGEPIEDDSTVTMVMTNNRVENITCTDNTIEGYRYRVVAAGATGHGHGACTGNKVCGDVVFENNHYGVGENHVHVADVITDDFVRDNGGNRVDMIFKTNK